MTIGERFKQMRQELKLTQPAMAEALKTSRATIANIEGDRIKNEASKAPLLKLACTTYGYSLDWILTGEGEKLIREGSTELAELVTTILVDKDDDFVRLVTSILATYQNQTPAAKEILKKFVRDLMG